jgi:hypothetical protein
MSCDLKHREETGTNGSSRSRGRLLRTLFAAALVATSLSQFARSPALAQQSSAARPNILVIFGDDIGQTNISAYSDGMTGYRTPNIDRIGREGMRFTDYYAENSCTAGRSTFITGQVCLRTGLCKVGIPGAPVGLQDRDVTIARRSSRSAMQRVNSARITLATATNICPLDMASTSFSATFITSTPKRSRSGRITRRTTLRSPGATCRVAC